MNPYEETLVPCDECKTINKIPIYANVGRYVWYPWWCYNCFHEHYYKKYFGCRTIAEAIMLDYKEGQQ